jgi:pyridinium-3,5-bisthiocarboxylic acid mononucleotide nickel chelatase
MRIAYLDCFSGISGDMFLGALLDAGVSSALLEQTVAALDLEARLEISRVTRSGISATKLDVYCHGEKDLPREQYWERRKSERGHKHEEHAHQHPPLQVLEHNYAVQDSLRTPERSSHPHGRGLKEIRGIVGQAAISDSARATALQIFDALGQAEAKIHNVDVGSVHFHEVGSVDAMVDIICAAVGAEALGVDAFFCSPLNVGGGTVRCEHGTFPVPAPATLELLKNAPLFSSGIAAELVTPTGAAIVKTLVRRFAPFPMMKTEKIGYGAGSRDFSDQPNVLRITVGDEMATANPLETVCILEANLDDLNPQIFGYVMDRLLEEGALDVFGVPIQMKKNRPGMLLTVLCQPANVPQLRDLIFRETTTLGVRHREESRQALIRKWVTVATRWGDVRIKVASRNGSTSNYAPEYEDCRRIAREQHVALKDVMQEATQIYLRSNHED